MVRPLAAGEEGAVCALLALAFEDNPSTLVNARGDKRRARRAMDRPFRILKLGNRRGHVLVAEQGDALIGALNAAPWPHCQMSATQKIRTAPAMLRAMGGALPRAMIMAGRRAKHDPNEPHWHVGPLGVDPHNQGRGVGKALLRSFLQLADQQGVPSFLETDVDRNVELYEGFGFGVASAEEILGVSTRFMWRAASALTTTMQSRSGRAA
jgi:GNAT superfamily N-acetyltransferase